MMSSAFSQLAQDFYHQLYWNGQIDWLFLGITILLLGAVLGTAWLFALLAFDALDYLLGTPSQFARGHVVGFHIEPSHTSLMPIWNGTTNTLMPVITPATYEVSVLVDGLGQVADIEVVKELYQNLARGEEVTVKYSHGFWTKDISAQIVQRH